MPDATLPQGSAEIIFSCNGQHIKHLFRDLSISATNHTLIISPLSGTLRLDNTHIKARNLIFDISKNNWAPEFKNSRIKTQCLGIVLARRAPEYLYIITELIKRNNISQLLVRYTAATTSEHIRTILRTKKKTQILDDKEALSIIGLPEFPGCRSYRVQDKMNIRYDQELLFVPIGKNKWECEYR